MIILNNCLLKKRQKPYTVIYQHPQHKHLISSYHYEYWLWKKYVQSLCEIIFLLSTHSTSTSVTSKSNKAMNKFYVLMLCVYLFPPVLSIQPRFQKIWLNILNKLWTNENVKTGYLCIWRSWVYPMAFCGHSFLIYKVRAWDRSDPQLPTLANFLILHVLLARSKSYGYIPICLPVCVHCADMVTTSLGA